MNPARLIAVRLAKEGFGSPVAILRTPVSMVLDMLNYSNFLADYSETAGELNKPEPT
jgi:hypothetical protein